MHLNTFFLELSDIGTPFLTIWQLSLQSSVNYSKKAIKNHHGEVPVVVQKKRKN